MPRSGYAFLLAVCSMLLLGACASTGSEEGVNVAAAAPPIDVPGASRAELARVPEQFPLPDGDPGALDASVGEDNGKQTVTLRFATDGRPEQNALLLGDHLAALGWRMAPSDQPDNGSSLSFEGFGWSGQAVFRPGRDRTADAVIVFKQTR